MENEKLYRSIGLPLGTWRLVQEAKSSRISIEVNGKYPTDHDVIAWLIRLGVAHMLQIEAKEQAFLEAKLGV